MPGDRSSQMNRTGLVPGKAEMKVAGFSPRRPKSMSADLWPVGRPDLGDEVGHVIWIGEIENVCADGEVSRRSLVANREIHIRSGHEDSGGGRDLHSHSTRPLHGPDQEDPPDHQPSSSSQGRWTGQQCGHQTKSCQNEILKRTEGLRHISCFSSESREAGSLLCGPTSTGDCQSTRTDKKRPPRVAFQAGAPPPVRPAGGCAWSERSLSTSERKARPPAPQNRPTRPSPPPPRITIHESGTPARVSRPSPTEDHRSSSPPSSRTPPAPPAPRPRAVRSRRRSGCRRRPASRSPGGRGTS